MVRGVPAHGARGCVGVAGEAGVADVLSNAVDSKTRGARHAQRLTKVTLGEADLTVCARSLASHVDVHTRAARVALGGEELGSEVTSQALVASSLGRGSSGGKGVRRSLAGVREGTGMLDSLACEG